MHCFIFDFDFDLNEIFFFSHARPSIAFGVGGDFSDFLGFFCH